MGFHLITKVYANVTGTSPTAQAVLAFLAHKADDNGARKCFPSVETIMTATHFGKTAVHGALNELREANLLRWKSGGRMKGKGGKALANEYDFNLPESRVREANHAEFAKRTKQSSPDGQCMVRETNTINKYQPLSQPSVIGDTEAATDDLKKEYEEVAAKWDATKEAARENVRIKQETRKGIIEEAMDAAGVPQNDIENKKIFASTLLRRSPQHCFEVILEFASQRRAGEHDNLRNPAAALNKRLAALPIIN